MTGHKKWSPYHLGAGLLVGVIAMVVLGYYWREAERRTATAAAELASATQALAEAEQRGTTLALEAKTSAAELATATEARGELEQDGTAIALEATASAREAATAQAQDAQTLAEQAMTIAAQATTLAESEAVRAEQQARLALAQRLAADSELALREGGGESLSLGALLAIESARQYPTTEGDRALRKALSLLSPLEFQFTTTGEIKQMAFDPGGRWLAASPEYTNSVTVWDLSTGKEIASLAHEDQVSGVAFDPTGGLIATTAADGTARLWETGSWQQIARLNHDENEIRGVSFNAEGTRLATRSDKTAYLWDVSTGQEITRLAHEAYVGEIRFSPSGKWVATSEDQGSNVWIWEVETGKLVSRLEHNSIVGSMVFSPYGKWLATASGDTAKVWEVNTGRQVVQVTHRGLVNDVAFSPDSLLLATASEDKTARLWEVATGREQRQLLHNYPVASLAFSPNGASLATGSSYDSSVGVTRLWDVATGQEIARMEHPYQVEELHFNPDGSKLATNQRRGNIIHLWDLSLGGPEALHFKRENGINAVAFSRDGSLLASGNYDGSLQVWDTTTWKEITPAPMKLEDAIRAIALSLDGSRLAAAASDGTASVWDLTTGEELIRVKHGGQFTSLTDVAFSPDGQLFATSGDDYTARLWELATGREIIRTTGTDTLWDVDFSPDGKRLAVAGSDEVRVFEAPTWQAATVLSYPGANDLAFSPDGALLVSVGQEDLARVWDTATWQEVVHMKYNDTEGAGTELAFSLDGRKLATGSWAMTRVWDTETWAEIARLPTEASQVLFSPDGRWLFTQSDIVRVWDLSLEGSEVARIEPTQDDTSDMALSPDGRLLAIANGGGELLVTAWQKDELVTEACSRLRRNLTWTEWRQYLGDEPYSESCPGLPTPLSESLREDIADYLEERMCLDDPATATSRYEAAVSLALDSDSAFLSNNVCWYGAQAGLAKTVLPACERAVELAPDDLNVLDSRGLARALAGDTEGALADLKPVVAAWEGDEQYAGLLSQRKQIIEAIEKDEDLNLEVETCPDSGAIKPTPGVKTPTPTATPASDASPTPPPEVVLQPTPAVYSFEAEGVGLIIGPPAPAGDFVYTLTVTNTGNVTDTYDLWAKPQSADFPTGFSLPDLTYRDDTFDYHGPVGTLGPGQSLQMPIQAIPYGVNGHVELISWLVLSQHAPTVGMQLVVLISDTTSLQQVGHVGLDARDVVARDDYAYVAAGMEGLRILKISDPLHPVEVGAYKTGEGALGQVESVQVVGDYAYLVTNLSGLRIVDVSDPTAPLEVGAYQPGGNIQTLKLAGNYAYVVWNACPSRCADRLRLVDISDPTAPLEMSAYGRSFAGNATGDIINDVAVLGDHAYLFLSDEMSLLDISDPARPVEVAESETIGREVVVFGDYAYIYEEKQVTALDISNPHLVVEVGSYEVPDPIVSLSSTGGYLYIATEPGDLYILDLAIPSSPSPVGLYEDPSNREVRGAAAKDPYVYLAAGPAGLQILDVSDPAGPKKAGVYGASASVTRFVLAEDYAYVADRYNGLRVLDLTANPVTPFELGSYEEPGQETLDIALEGDYAYLIFSPCGLASNLYCSGDLHILDISNPASPVEAGVYKGNWRKVELWGDYAFVMGKSDDRDDKSFQILNVSEPAAPKSVAAYLVSDFALAEGYLYLLNDAEERLTILDAVTLKQVGLYDLPEHDPEASYSRGITVAGDYAYIFEHMDYTTFSGSGWQVVDISDPTAPVGLAPPSYGAAAESGGHPVAATYGGYTFLTGNSRDLSVLDLTGVDIPAKVDAFSAVGSIIDVAVDEAGYIYVASTRGGLYILRYEP